MTFLVNFVIITLLIIVDFVKGSFAQSLADCLLWNNESLTTSPFIACAANNVSFIDFSCFVRTCFLNDGFGIFLLVAFSVAVILSILMVCIICIGVLCACIFRLTRYRSYKKPMPIVSLYSGRREDVAFQGSQSNQIDNDRSIILSGTSDRSRLNHASVMYESFHLEDHSKILSTSSNNPRYQAVEDKPNISKPNAPNTETVLNSPSNTTGLLISNENAACEHRFDEDSIIYEEVTNIYDAFEKGEDLNQENDSFSRIACNSNVIKDLKTATIVLSNRERKKIGNNYESVFGRTPNQSQGELTYFKKEALFINPSTDLSKIYDDMSSLKIREIKRETLSFNEKLGHGNFAVVYKGVWASNFGDIPVAVKVLNKNNQPEQLVGVLREAAAMAQFDHPNIVKLFGVVTLGKPFVIVSELLKDQLVYFLYKFNRSPIPKSKFPNLLLKFCTDICLGMEYLAGLKFVHRDLAARNVLVAVNLTCRIADFGMCREFKKESDYYKASGGYIPVRWTAPESIFYQRFSEFSDVWSFGMTMYEVWSLGVKPWHTLSTEEVVDVLVKQTLPTPPTGCPRDVYELMVDIWNHEPEHRPTFQEVKHRLKAIKLPISTSSDPANIPGNEPHLSKDLYLDLQNKHVQK